LADFQPSPEDFKTHSLVDLKLNQSNALFAKKQKHCNKKRTYYLVHKNWVSLLINPERKYVVNCFNNLLSPLPNIFAGWSMYTLDIVVHTGCPSKIWSIEIDTYLLALFSEYYRLKVKSMVAKLCLYLPLLTNHDNS